MKPMNKAAVMKPIKPSITLKPSPYLGEDLQSEVLLIRENFGSLWYDVRLSRAGKTLRYHGLHLSKPYPSEERVVQILLRILHTDWCILLSRPTYSQFNAFHDGDCRFRDYLKTKRMIRLTERFIPFEDLRDLARPIED